jgi:hypothetical protein
MWLFNQSSSAARTALIYITAGAFVVIWSVVWYVYLQNNLPDTNTAYYWSTGFLVTGLALVLIGLGLGQISRSAGRADLPQEAVPLAVRNLQENVATPALVVAPANSTVPVFAQDGQVVITAPKRDRLVLEAGGAPSPNLTGRTEH